MIKITSDAQTVQLKLVRWITEVSVSGRQLLYSAAANAVAILTRRHISRLASWKHISAESLGAQPTGHLEKAARATVHHATQSYGEVVIPSPGFSRAFHDVEIRPRDAQALTIPAAAESYGKRASVLSALGWKIFRPKGKRVLMGSMQGDEAKVLYFLCSSVRQRQDRTLLPSDEEINQTAGSAVLEYIRTVQRKAS
jgi:hypothetical protein